MPTRKTTKAKFIDDVQVTTDSLTGRAGLNLFACYRPVYKKGKVVLSANMLAGITFDEGRSSLQRGQRTA